MIVWWLACCFGNW